MNQQALQEYQEKMGSPEMEYLQYLSEQEEKPTLQQLKEEARVEFENLERKTERGMWWVRLDRVQQIKDSLITKAYEEGKRNKAEQIEKEVSKFEVYDDEADNCRRIISEIKYFLNN